MRRFASSYPVFVALAIAAVFFTPLARGQLKIDSFGANGLLSWSDPGGTGTHYAVQWAPAVDGPWLNWQDAVARLTGLGPTGTTNVPMFYRVVTPDPTYQATNTYTYFQGLEPFNPNTALETNEMRITFMGSMIPLPVRRAQAEMSVFVEVGWIKDTTTTAGRWTSSSSTVAPGYRPTTRPQWSDSAGWTRCSSTTCTATT
jgi:hypothetical protein